MWMRSFKACVCFGCLCLCVCAWVCVSRQSSSIYSWLALCPYKYACMRMWMWLQWLLCAIFFPYGRMQPFFLRSLLSLLFCLCYYPSFFHAILSWHSLDELFSAAAAQHIFCWFLFSFCFYLPHFMRPKTLIVFHFLLFAAATICVQQQ